MTPEQSAAFINSQTACAMITAMGMHAENKQREVLGHSMAYVNNDFIGLINKSGIGHNDIMTTINAINQ